MTVPSIESSTLPEGPVVALAERVFGSPDKALQWLQLADDRLGGLAPISVLGSTSGVETVTSMLFGIDEGVYI